MSTFVSGRLRDCCYVLISVNSFSWWLVFALLDNHPGHSSDEKFDTISARDTKDCLASTPFNG